jgi:hypothetical protein
MWLFLPENRFHIEYQSTEAFVCFVNEKDFRGNTEIFTTSERDLRGETNSKTKWEKIIYNDEQ